MPAGNLAERGSLIVGNLVGPCLLAALGMLTWRYHYCLGIAYMELGDIEQAQKHFQMVLENEAPEDLRGLARNGLPEIAVRGPKPRGPRMDAVFYLLDALRLFRGKVLEDAGWFRVLELPGYYFPPELKEGLESCDA
jgi:tetratricopeptide (TPR) repeat protein